VVVPAYNAEKTVGETLESALAQTYENIEVIVVDDGSTDDTGGIVKEVASTDKRVRIIEQANAGVAAARNTAILQSSGDFIAPLDADDLWHPSSIEKRMNVLVGGGSNMSAVYAGSRVIDEDSYVIGSLQIFTYEGYIFGPLLCQNIVGNGSNLLMRKNAILAVGGYDSGLRAAGAEGCEDELLQLRLASQYAFGCVPEYLTGYRQRPGAMSSDAVRMFDSEQRVFKQVEAIAPTVLKPLARRGAAESLFFMGHYMLRRGQVLSAFGVIAQAHARHLGCGLACGTQVISGKIRSWRRKKLNNTAGYRTLRRFSEYDPKEQDVQPAGYLASRRFAWLAAREQQAGCSIVPEQSAGTVGLYPRG
jgi:hypothetical protein